MVNRRTVLKVGATSLSGALLNLPVLRGNAAPERTHSAFQRAVFDDRFAECQAFATEFESAAVGTSAIRGDVAGLWYDDLRVHLSKNRTPVAGLTDRPALFCLEELARDVGMHGIFRVDHIIDQNGHTQHSAVGTASLVAVARKLAPEAVFGRAIAVLLSQFDISEPRDTSAQKRTGPISPHNKPALVSWLIARTVA
jgi:hypothetical protein